MNISDEDLKRWKAIFEYSQAVPALIGEVGSLKAQVDALERIAEDRRNRAKAAELENEKLRAKLEKAEAALATAEKALLQAKRDYVDLYEGNGQTGVCARIDAALAAIRGER